MTTNRATFIRDGATCGTTTNRATVELVDIETSQRPGWDEYGLILARAASSRAACTRSQCGAVVMDKWHRIVSVGYNGVESGETHCSDGGCPRGKLTYSELPPLGDYSNCPGIHAERNAIEYADFEDCRQSTLYVTREPCTDCRELAYCAGIIRIVWSEGEISFV